MFSCLALIVIFFVYELYVKFAFKVASRKAKEKPTAEVSPPRCDELCQEWCDTETPGSDTSARCRCIVVSVACFEYARKGDHPSVAEKIARAHRRQLLPERKGKHPGHLLLPECEIFPAAKRTFPPLRRLSQP